MLLARDIALGGSKCRGNNDKRVHGGNGYIVPPMNFTLSCNFVLIGSWYFFEHWYESVVCEIWGNFFFFFNKRMVNISLYVTLFTVFNPSACILLFLFFFFVRIEIKINHIYNAWFTFLKFFIHCSRNKEKNYFCEVSCVYCDAKLLVVNRSFNCNGWLVLFIMLEKLIRLFLVLSTVNLLSVE